MSHDLLYESRIEIIFRTYGARPDATGKTSTFPRELEWIVLSDGEKKYSLRYDPRIQMDAEPISFDRWLGGEYISFKVGKRGQNSRQPFGGSQSVKDSRDGIWRLNTAMWCVVAIIIFLAFRLASL